MSEIYRRCFWIVVAVNSGSFGAVAGALAVEVDGTTGAFVALTGVSATMGLSILALYRLLSLSDDQTPTSSG